MAENLRTGERNLFRTEPGENDTKAGNALTPNDERRRGIAAVDEDFLPPPGGARSNLPAMADLEEELLREFAIYDDPRAGEAPQRREPVFEAPSSVAAKAPEVTVADDLGDETMPPMDFAPSSLRVSAPVAAPAPAPKYEQRAEPSFDVADEAAEPESEEVVFDGPVPEWDFTADIEDKPTADAEAGGEPDFGEPAFAGPVPDLDLDLDTDDFAAEAAFAGPVPDFDFGDEPSFKGPVPDLDLDLEDEPATAAASGASDESDLIGELELSLGAIDLQHDSLLEPHSKFAEWKRDRLSAGPTSDERIDPSWVPVGSRAEPVLVEADDVSEAQDEKPVAPVASAIAAEAVSASVTDDPTTDEDLLGEPLSAVAFDVPELPSAREPAVEPGRFEGLLDAADLGDRIGGASAKGGAADPFDGLDFLNRKPSRVEPVESASLFSMTPMAPVASAVGAVGAASAIAAFNPSTAFAAEPKVEPQKDDIDDFDFDFDFDESEIEAAVSQAVMTEMERGAPNPAVQASAEPEELPFDPTQISELDERMPATIADLNVPVVADNEGEPNVETVSDFDYDIEAEMAELFAVSKKGRSNAVTLPLTDQAQPAQQGSDEDLYDHVLEEDLTRTYHDQNAIPLPRALNLDTHNMRQRSVFAGRYAKIAAFAGLVAFAGVGAVMLWHSGKGADMLVGGEPKVILADKSPVKSVPENPGGKQVPNQDKAVYDRVQGKTSEDLKQGSLIQQNDVPMNVAEKTLENDPSVTPDATQPPAADAAAAATDPASADARLPADTSAQKLAGQEDTAALTPRKVKTMIVLPNGTLVAREEPAPQATTPALSPSDAQPLQKADAQTPANSAAQASAPAPATDASQAAQPTANPPVDTAVAVKTSKPVVSAPVPVPRPVEQPVNIVGTVSQKGKVTPAPTADQAVASAATTPAKAPAPEPAAAAPAAAPVAGGAYVIQIASLPSQAEAEKSFANLSKKFSSVIGGKSSDIRAASVSGKGTFYRVRVVAGTKDQAIALCERYRAAGGSCLVSR